MTSVAFETDGSQATNPEVKASASHGNSLDPKGFLLGVMSDETIELHLRIEAAKDSCLISKVGTAAELAEDRQVIGMTLGSLWLAVTVDFVSGQQNQRAHRPINIMGLEYDLKKQKGELDAQKLQEAICPAASTAYQGELETD